MISIILAITIYFLSVLCVSYDSYINWWMNKYLYKYQYSRINMNCLHSQESLREIRCCHESKNLKNQIFDTAPVSSWKLLVCHFTFRIFKWGTEQNCSWKRALLCHQKPKVSLLQLLLPFSIINLYLLDILLHTIIFLLHASYVMKN